MTISDQTYKKIISLIKPAPPETGGILGGISNTVTYFVFDVGLNTKQAGCYYPDTQRLNHILSLWQCQNIEFYGIVHSHIDNQTTLSSGDIQYIKKIMYSMPHKNKSLYFPLVINNKLFSYKATLINKRIYIENDIIKFC